MLSISEESEEPALAPEGSMSNNHAVGLLPYQTCPNGTLDAEPEEIWHERVRNLVSVRQRRIEGIIMLFGYKNYTTMFVFGEVNSTSPKSFEQTFNSYSM